MEYKCEIVGDNVQKVSLDGRLVAACSEKFKSAMFEHLAGQRKVVFDLSKMSHIDSSGLGALVSLLQWLNSNGGSGVTTSSDMIGSISTGPHLGIALRKASRAQISNDRASESTGWKLPSSRRTFSEVNG